jgi:hypothetical protein
MLAARRAVAAIALAAAVTTSAACSSPPAPLPPGDVPNAAPATTTPAAPTGLTPRTTSPRRSAKLLAGAPPTATSGSASPSMASPSTPMHDHLRPEARARALREGRRARDRREHARGVPIPGLSADYWSAIGPDGVTQPDVGSSAAYSCVDPDKTGLPLQLAPASKYRGSVVLDVADVTGTLVFTLPTGGPGWEWQYGVNA